MERNNTYKISVRDKDYNASNNTSFNIKEITQQDLRSVVKKNNYSLITWKSNIRKAENFRYAAGCVIDIDNGLTIEKARERLKKKGLNHFIVTSKRHTKEINRFHILVFFNYPVHCSSTYGQIIEDITKIFPEADKSVLDPARFIFGSPDDCEIHEYWNAEDFDVSGYQGLWDRGTELLDKDSNAVALSEKMDKTPIFCPFHQDNEPSAFVDHSGENFFIYCSACGQTFWMFENREAWLARKCKNFYTYGKEIVEFSFVDDNFDFIKISLRKFYSLVGANNAKLKEELWDYIANKKDIKQLRSINYITNVNASESYYESDLGKGLFKAYHRAIPSNIKDNIYIDNYLEGRFGEYKDFIKQWLAVFCYTDYEKLPTLVFSGPRGCGKTSFAEIVAKIYPPLSYKWHFTKSTFTHEVVNKFIYVEENQGDKVHQYKTLKEYSGSESNNLRKLFKDPIPVKNNMNFCILSNETIPVFVRSEEMPTDSWNNQFFVYEFPALPGRPDAQIQKKILERLGHYIRTELKAVFDGLILKGVRYSIDVPITKYEKALFENNITENEQEVEEFVSELTDTSSDLFAFGNYQIFVEKGQIPVKLIKEYKQYNYQKLIKGMIKMKYITGKAQKAQVGGIRHYCYKMTDKLFDMIKAKPDTVS